MLGITRKVDAEINCRNHWQTVIKDLEYQRFTIFRELPSHNAYIHACKGGQHSGAKFKREIEDDIIRCIMASDIKPRDEPCVVHIDWFESTGARDADNVNQGIKFILDALQKAGILKNDNRKYVKQISHNIIPCKESGVWVWLIYGSNVIDF